MSWFTRSMPDLAEEVEHNFRLLRLGDASYKLSSNDILTQIHKLHNETRRIKDTGVSMWNYKSVLPRIFDVVEGAFVVMEEVVKKLGELENEKK